LRSSLFDDDNDNDEPPFTTRKRKFTGAGGGGSRGGRDDETEPGNGDGRIPRDEFNLVRLATSPQAFLLQAAAILVLGAFMVFVAATGQLGSNENYLDDDVQAGDVQNTVNIQKDRNGGGVHDNNVDNKPSVWI